MLGFSTPPKEPNFASAPAENVIIYCLTILLCYNTRTIRKGAKNMKAAEAISQSGRVDLTRSDHFDDFVLSHGAKAAWEARIAQLTAKEAKPNLTAREKQYLRLMLYNAHTQLNLIRFEGW